MQKSIITLKITNTEIIWKRNEMVVKRTLDERQTFLHPGSHRVFLNGGRRTERQTCQIKKCGGFLFTLIEKNNGGNKESMKKKIITILLAVCVFAGMAASPAAGSDVKAEENTVEADGDTDGEGFVCIGKLPDNTLCIVDYRGNDADIVIPAEIDGKTVSDISNMAFANCQAVSITIPESIKALGSFNPFYKCRLSAGITVSENNLNFSSLDGDLYNKTQSVLYYCHERESGIYQIPESVREIENHAFSGCPNLNRITIPEGVTTIGYGAFEYGNFNSITIPESVTSIGTGVFYKCSSLSSITMPKEATYIGYNAFYGCSSLRSIVIPDHVTQIGHTTFYNCRNLSSVTLPDSITSIYYCAFEECSSLEDIYYKGSKAQFMEITINSDRGSDDAELHDDDLIASYENSKLYNAVIHCTDGDFCLSGKPPVTKPDVIPLNADNVLLSTEKVTYSGKPQTPAVTVKDKQGKTVSGSDYTVQYTNHTNVGQASVTVTFKGNYSGTVTKTFDIVPNGTKISKITAKKKGFTVKWKKQAVQTSGYEIQYSTSGKFKGAKTAGNIKAKKTSKTVSRLKPKKKYFVRIRTYKTVNGKKYYSDWSAKKSVKTKK